MKRSKLLISIMSLCFALGVLTFGVFSANSATYTLSGNLSYTVTDAFISVNTRVYGSEYLSLANMYNKIDAILDTSSFNATTEQLRVVDTGDLSYNSLTNNKASANKTLSLTFSAGGQKSMAYFVVFDVTNLGQNPIWIDAGKLFELPNNVYSVNSGVQTNVAHNVTKRLVIAIAPENVSAPVSQTSYTMPLYAEEGNYTLLNYATYNTSTHTIAISDTSIGSTGHNPELKDLVIPSYINESRVTTCGSFANCTSLTSIYVPTSMYKMSYRLFAGCESLTRLIIPFLGEYSPNAVEESDWECGGATNKYFGFYFGDDSYDNNSNLYYFCSFNGDYGYLPKSLTRVTLLFGFLTIIEGESFNADDSEHAYIQQIDIPYGVTYIGSAVFGNLPIDNFEIPNTVTFLCRDTFRNTNWENDILEGNDIVILTATDLVTKYLITVKDDITYVSLDVNVISCNCFGSVNNLTEVTISNRIEIINNYAFQDSRITSITINKTTPPIIGDDLVFRDTTNIYVPSGSVTAYQCATNWSTYASRIQAIA